MERGKELVKAIKNNHLFDYIGNNGYEFSQYELIQIIKELVATCDDVLKLYYEQDVFNERLLDNMFEYNSDTLFDVDCEDLTEDEIVYKRYELGIDTYEDYLRVCEIEECEPLPEIKED